MPSDFFWADPTHGTPECDLHARTDHCIALPIALPKTILGHSIGHFDAPMAPELSVSILGVRPFPTLLNPRPDSTHCRKGDRSQFSSHVGMPTESVARQQLVKHVRPPTPVRFGRPWTSSVTLKISTGAPGPPSLRIPYPICLLRVGLQDEMQFSSLVTFPLRRDRFKQFPPGGER